MARILENFRDNTIASKLARKIEALANGRRIKIVHVCGTHEDAIIKNGLRSLLPTNVEVIMGPGCPVCTVPPNRIDYAIGLAKKGFILTTFGDMMRVPTSKGSLADAKTSGSDIRIVYSIHDSVELAKKTQKQVIHFGVGFETTAPTSASELLANPPSNFSIYSCHLLIPPAIQFLLKSEETRADGFINPGHVSSIIGVDGYSSTEKKFKVPQVIAGFEPLDILIAISMILEQIKDGRSDIENAYPRAVRKNGNRRALKMMNEVFDTRDAPWRGIGTIPKSGLTLRREFYEHDASKLYDINEEVDYSMPHGCRCGEVLRAVCYPWECPLYRNSCTPDSPIGPCMVSSEGSCFIAARYGADI